MSNFAWVSSDVNVILGALLYGAASYFVREMKLNFLRERGQNPPGATMAPSFSRSLHSISINIAGAALHCEPFALVYCAWQSRDGR